jgi:hypothetical protein
MNHGAWSDSYRWKAEDMVMLLHKMRLINDELIEQVWWAI